MDLLEDFDRARDNFSELGLLTERLHGTIEEEGYTDTSFTGPAVSSDLPSLSVDVTVRQASRWAPSLALCQPLACHGRGASAHAPRH